MKRKKCFVAIAIAIVVQVALVNRRLCIRGIYYSQSRKQGKTVITRAK